MVDLGRASVKLGKARGVAACPSCGQKGRKIRLIRGRGVFGYYFLECPYCRHSAWQAFTWRGAIRKWNRDAETRRREYER